jgi:hypothetical protein
LSITAYATLKDISFFNTKSSNDEAKEGDGEEKEGETEENDVPKEDEPEGSMIFTMEFIMIFLFNFRKQEHDSFGIFSQRND